MTDDFIGHPKTIGELRAEKSQNASHWTPRDMLVSMLRAIDEGKLAPNVMVICFSQAEGDESETNWWASSPNPLMTHGVVAKCAYRINRSGENDV